MVEQLRHSTEPFCTGDCDKGCWRPIPTKGRDLMAMKLEGIKRETTGLKLFPLFTLLGWILIGISILVSVLVLAPTAAGYWGDSAKAVHDGAEIGSALLVSLTTLSWWPKVLAPLTFLGISSFMVGIALGFASIPGILDRRIEVLKEALTVVVRTLQFQETALHTFAQASAEHG